MIIGPELASGPIFFAYCYVLTQRRKVAEIKQSNVLLDLTSESFPLRPFLSSLVPLR